LRVSPTLNCWVGLDARSFPKEGLGTGGDRCCPPTAPRRRADRDRVIRRHAWGLGVR